MDAFFRENVSATTGSTIMARYEEAKTDAGNPFNEVWFTGRELYEGGLATEIFSSTSAFVKKFTSTCLAEIDKDAGLSFFCSG